jgi:acyl dehydratase
MTATTYAHTSSFDAQGLRYDDVQVGDQLPTLPIELTRTLIVATAIASRDYQDVHHDPGLAEERGSPDIFMNILTTNGFVGRYVTDWAGPNALLKSVKIRLGAPNYPGDTMTMTGAVTKKENGLIEVALKGSNKLGDHVIGTVTLELPSPPVKWSAGDATGATGATGAKADKQQAKAERTRAKKDKKAKKKGKK